jgi:hypothetical protein
VLATAIVAPQIADEMKRATNEANMVSTGPREPFSRLRDAFLSLRERRGSLLAIDVEAWEINHASILEVGWSVVSWSQGQDQEQRETHHASASLRVPI